MKIDGNKVALGNSNMKQRFLVFFFISKRLSETFLLKYQDQPRLKDSFQVMLCSLLLAHIICKTVLPHFVQAFQG